MTDFIVSQEKKEVAVRVIVSEKKKTAVPRKLMMANGVTTCMIMVQRSWLLMMMLMSIWKDPCVSPYTAQEAARNRGIVAMEEMHDNVSSEGLSTEGFPVFW